MNTIRTSQTIKILVWLAVTLFTAFLYTFLHESGHALVGILSGGQITAFSVNFWQLSAHVGMDASLTPGQMLINNLAGVGLPLLVLFVFLLTVSRHTNLVIVYLKIIGSLIFLSTLFAWILLPVLTLFGISPSDDVTNFIRNSGVYPLWVTAAALLILVGGGLLAVNRLGGANEVVKILRTTNVDLSSSGTRISLLGLVFIFIICMLVAFGLNGFQFSSSFYQPPAGYRLLQAINLSESAHDQSVICDFTLTQPTQIGVHLLIEKVDSDYLEVRLTGEADYDNIIVHAEGYTAEKDTPRMETTLQPGRYTCLLTSLPSTGTLSLYIKGLP